MKCCRRDRYISATTTGILNKVAPLHGKFFNKQNILPLLINEKC